MLIPGQERLKQEDPEYGLYKFFTSSRAASLLEEPLKISFFFVCLFCISLGKFFLAGLFKNQDSFKILDLLQAMCSECFWQKETTKS